jgi:hypothetical protein
MKQSKKTIYFRYEFSDETGKLEGGDIFQFSSVAKALEMTSKILKVAHSDGVAVNITTGEEKPFFGFLANVGINRARAEQEMVDLKVKTKPAKKKTTKKKKK